MKLLYKLISVILTTAIVYISCCSASDSGVMKGKEPAYIPPPPVHKAPRTILIEKPPEATKPPAPPEVQPEAAKPEVPSAETAEKPHVEKAEMALLEQPQVKETEELQPEPPQAPKKPVTKQGRNFTSVLFSVLVALGKTVVLILTLTGAYLIFKKVRTKKAPGKTEKGAAEEPQTIEEAVSSYIKHKLRK